MGEWRVASGEWRWAKRRRGEEAKRRRGEEAKRRRGEEQGPSTARHPEGSASESEARPQDRCPGEAVRAVCYSTRRESTRHIGAKVNCLGWRAILRSRLAFARATLRMTWRGMHRGARLFRHRRSHAFYK